MDEYIQGVRSQIEFPLGQDEQAVGQAIACLLNERWLFHSLTKTHITLYREWEVNTNPQVQQSTK